MSDSQDLQEKKGIPVDRSYKVCEAVKELF